MNLLPAESLAAIQSAALLIRRAKRTVILTGAGYSTPSGIPDFRTAGSGLWTKFLPMEVASLSTFRTNPELFYAWLRPLASHMLTAQPNEAHFALARLEAAGYLFTIITQNTDGLHHRAGSKNVLELHGSYRSARCLECEDSFSNLTYDWWVDRIHASPCSPVVLCPSCQRSVLKPDLVFFDGTSSSAHLASLIG